MAVIVRALFRERGDGRGDLVAPPRFALHVHPAPPSVRVVADDPSIDEAGLRDEVWKLVHTGHMINAIKLVRERTGLGLKEAKDYVDALRQDDVTLR